jgi:Flp pilus assembly protein TadD
MKTIRRGLLLAALWMPAIPMVFADTSSRDVQKAATICQAGSKALGTGNLEKAREEYQKALAAVAAYPEAHMGLATIHMKQGRFDEALRAYEKARDGFAEMGDVLFDIQVKKFQSTQRQITELRDTLNQYKSALGKTVGTTDAHVQQQITEIENSISNLEAIQMPSQSAKREPPGEIFFYIGNAQFRLGRFEEAQKSWERCAERSPKFAMVHNNLAVAYWKTGQFDAAKQALARATELGFPVNPQFKADLEKAAAAAGKSDGAARP